MEIFLYPFTSFTLDQLIVEYSPRAILINDEQKKSLMSCFTYEEWYRMSGNNLEAESVEWHGVTIVFPPGPKRQGTLDLRNGEAIFKNDEFQR